MANNQSCLALGISRIEAERTSWRQTLAQTEAASKLARESVLGSNNWLAKEMKVLRSPAMKFARHYQDILGAKSSAMQAIKAWQETERVKHEKMLRMLDPLTDIRKSFLVDNTTQKLIKELTPISSILGHINQLVGQGTGIGVVSKMIAQQVDESRQQHRRLLDSMTGVSRIQNYLKEFETINKQWMVPSEVLGIVGSFKDIQEQFGRVSLPTIDWGSAGALAEILGSEGIKEQLALLGIGPDGAMHLPDEIPERGILSRKQSDAVALVSLLLSILFVIYQEGSALQDKTKTEAFQTQTTSTLQVQSQQIQNLTVLIGQALAKAATLPEERFVVRERPATVRGEPEHGAPVQGKLFPNEVVRAIERKGRWVKIEYYHWLQEEYRTGWVLKHYLERVPASYSKNDTECGEFAK